MQERLPSWHLEGALNPCLRCIPSTQQLPWPDLTEPQFQFNDPLSRLHYGHSRAGVESSHATPSQKQWTCPHASMTLWVVAHQKRGTSEGCCALSSMLAPSCCMSPSDSPCHESIPAFGRIVVGSESSSEVPCTSAKLSFCRAWSHIMIVWTSTRRQVAVCVVDLSPVSALHMS